MPKIVVLRGPATGERMVAQIGQEIADARHAERDHHGNRHRV